MEYAAAFGGGQVLVELTLTLTNLGHPQQSPPLLFVDNECAIGLATSSVRPKKSKSIDMGLDWIRERAGQNFFRLVFLPGLINPADFFTKSLLVYRPYLSFTAPHTILHPHPFCPHPPTHHIPPSPTFQSPRCSPRQGQTYLSLPLTSPHLFLPISAPIPACNASNKPSLSPCSWLLAFPTVKAVNPMHLTTPAPAPPPDVGLNLFRVCLALFLPLLLLDFTLS
jgi:hypothetical protein